MHDTAGYVRTALVVALFVATAACTSLGGLEPPDLTLTDLELTDATLFETSLHATVRIVNPNPDPLEVDGMAVRLYVDGLKVGKAVSSARVTVPRLGSVTVPLELYVNNVALLTRLKPVLESRSLAWALKGKLYLVTSYGTKGLGLSSEGVLKAPPTGTGPQPEDHLATPETTPKEGGET